MTTRARSAPSTVDALSPRTAIASRRSRTSLQALLPGTPATFPAFAAAMTAADLVVIDGIDVGHVRHEHAGKPGESFSFTCHAYAGDRLLVDADSRIHRDADGRFHVHGPDGMACLALYTKAKS